MQQTITLPPKNRLNAKEFYTFCAQNLQLNCELSSQGEIIIKSPTYSGTSKYNLEGTKAHSKTLLGFNLEITAILR